MRVSYYDFENPFELGGTEHPSQANDRTRESASIFGTWSKVLNDDMVQDFDWTIGIVYADFPQLVFPGLSVGPERNHPQEFWQNQWNGRYELNVHKTRHDIKLGGEFNAISLEGDELVAGAAVSLPRLARYCASQGRGGVEFFVGIVGMGSDGAEHTGVGFRDRQ